MTNQNKIKQRRKELGLTQFALATKAGISVGTILMVEGGWRPNKEKCLTKIAKALKVSLDFIGTRKDMV